MTSMSEPRDIEKKSLEAHVELCAERYNHLESQLESINNKITVIEKLIYTLNDAIAAADKNRNAQLINWGIGIIGTLMVVIGFLLKNKLF